MRVPLKFGDQVLTEVICARAHIAIEDESGTVAQGWGETPLSVGWVWPSQLDYQYRQDALLEFCQTLARDLGDFSHQNPSSSSLELGFDFIQQRLPSLRHAFNQSRSSDQALPLLASLVCFSAFDLAIHDAFGNLHQLPTWQTYGRQFIQRDLASLLPGTTQFENQYPDAFIQLPSKPTLPVWHLVGGLDPIEPDELTGNEPTDDYPILLRDWIRRDGLTCLKIKLRGNDWDWDFDRLIKIGQIADQESVEWLTTDFNCTVTDPAYVNSMLDQIAQDHPLIFQKILYVEQPFPHDLTSHQIDVHSVASRKPLLMDESAHDWQFVQLGRELGWNGVALKTCKTQTGAILSLCFAKAHQMHVMVQDLTNPMLAQISHFQLASHANTMMGIESNGMQFYPDASLPEQAIHPGLYRRSNGILDGSTLGASGMGYCIDAIERTLPDPVMVAD